MKHIVEKHYRQIVEQAAASIQSVKPPPEGWIRTMRKALHMSGAQLARRAGVSRARVSKVEMAELDGSVTLKQLAKLAESMDSKLVYAIVPRTSIDDILESRAHSKARELVRNASVHMSLESQALPEPELKAEIDRIKGELLFSQDRSLWND